MDTTPEDIADPESDFEEKLEEISEHDDEQVTGVDEPPAPPYQVTDTDDVGPLPEEDEKKIRKFHVNGVAVGVIAQRVQYYDADGKLVTESLKITPAKHCSKNMPRWMTLPASGKTPIAKKRSFTSWNNRGSSGKYWQKKSVKISTRSTCFAT